MNTDKIITVPTFSCAPAYNNACAVCGDKVYSSRHGAPACLGCTVFFRRAVLNKTQCRCFRDERCFISRVFRGACRFCRFQKCLRVGLHPDSIWKKYISMSEKIKKQVSVKPDVVIIYENTEHLLYNFAMFQKKQHQQSLQYFTDHNVAMAFRRDESGRINFRRRAQARDVSVMLKLCLKQASEFGDQLKPFKRLPPELKKSALSEYFLAFLLIEQGFKTSQAPDHGTWLIQNESFMHPDYNFGLPAKNIDLTQSEKIRLHHGFVTKLVESIAHPFRKLKIDEIECVVLKILLLLGPSCSKRAIYAGQEGLVAEVFTYCSEELMNHCVGKNYHDAVERFGELFLLIGSIRCGIKTIYNQTKLSDLFTFKEFDASVRNILLE